MKYLKKFDDINESISKPQYKYDWCQPENPIRRKIEKGINDILVDLKDSDIYSYHIWWTASGTKDQQDPYVYITGSLKNNGRSAFSRFKPVLSEVNPLIDRIISYLDSEGFSCKTDYVPNKENCKQFYIYFKEKSSS